MSARMEGLPELRATLANVAAAEISKAKREIKRSALNVVNGAKRRAPVDTGRLRNSLTHEIDADGLDARIGTNVEYAPHVEFGTFAQRAQPYLFPALEEERAGLLARLRKLEFKG